MIGLALHLGKVLKNPAIRPLQFFGFSLRLLAHREETVIYRLL